MAGRLFALVRAPRILVLSFSLVVAGMLGVFAIDARTPVADAASSKFLMCNWTVEQRTQTVYIDPSSSRTGVSRAQVLAAFESWNKLFVKYHGFPIFAEHKGSKATADVVIDARSVDRTWVDGVCNPAYKSRGKSHTTVFLGVKDRWRNAAVMAHELGHALGLADHGSHSQHVAGHIGFQPCSTYLGVMSYCAGPQTWFLDIEAAGLYFDGQLVRDYWK